MRFTSLKLNSLRDLLLEELRDLYNAEQQLTEALPKMANAAKAPDLKSAFNHHLEQTKQQASRLEHIFAGMNEQAAGETCEAMKGLIKEGELIIKAEGDADVRDAGLIGAAQRVEHYEMAGICEEDSETRGESSLAPQSGGGVLIIALVILPRDRVGHGLSRTSRRQS